MRTIYVSLVLTLISIGLSAQNLTILHTNDMHSRLLGFAPNADYTPLTTGDDNTIGGFARIAGLIKEIRKEKAEQVLVLDGGDFTMGTLFHTLEAETGFQLQLMSKMGYDAVAIGNHEFDWGPEKLGSIIARAKIGGKIPSLLLSNIEFSDIQYQDDLLANMVDRGIVKPYEVIEKNGLKIGLFGILGIEASMVAPYAAPATFTDPVMTAKEIAGLLKNEEQVDIVICLSHSGVIETKKGKWEGEDVALAKAVPEIDLIISGHTHTSLHEPIQLGKQWIVQAGSEGRTVGRVELSFSEGDLQVTSSKLVPINDDIQGDPDIQALIEKQQKKIGQAVFADYDFEIDKPLVETAFDLRFNEATNLETSNLGPLVADALYWYTARYDPLGTDLVLVPGGIIRDEILKGETGQQLPADIFRILPLGSGVYEDTPGYSMVKIYLTGREIKTVLEVMLLAPKISSGNFGYWAGVKYYYNALRMPLDQIYKVEIGNEEEGYQAIKLSKDENKLYGLVTNSYVLEFLGLVDQITKGILKITPKFRNGEEIADLRMTVIDRDKHTPGTQEAKEWAALMSYLAQLPDLNGNRIPDVPEKYREPIKSGFKQVSINPVKLIKSTNGITLVPSVLLAGVLTGVGFIIF